MDCQSQWAERTIVHRESDNGKHPTYIELAGQVDVLPRQKLKPPTRLVNTQLLQPIARYLYDYRKILRLIWHQTILVGNRAGADFTFNGQKDIPVNNNSMAGDGLKKRSVWVSVFECPGLIERKPILKSMKDHFYCYYHFLQTTVSPLLVPRIWRARLLSFVTMKHNLTWVCSCLSCSGLNIKS